MKKLVLFLACAVLLALPVFATQSLEVGDNFGWTNQGCLEGGSSYVTESGISSAFGSVIKTSTHALGSNFEPLILDITGDSKNDLVIVTGSNADLFKLDASNNLAFVDDAYLDGFTQSFAGSIALINTSVPVYIVPMNNFLYVLRANSSQIWVQDSFNITAINSSYQTFSSNVQCTSTINPDACYFAASNNLVKFVPQTKAFSHIYKVPSCTSSSTLTLGDWDSDGNTEIGLGCTNRKVWIVDPVTRVKQFNVTISDSFALSAGKSGFFKIFGAGAEPYFFTWTRSISNNFHNYLSVITAPSTLTTLLLSYDDGILYGSNAVWGWTVGHFTSNTTYQICAWSMTKYLYGSQKNYLTCYNTAWTQIYKSSANKFLNSTATSLNGLASADYDGDGLDEIIFSNAKGQMYNLDSGVTVNTSSLINPVLADLNDDYFGEIIGNSAVYGLKALFSQIGSTAYCTWCDQFSYADSVLNHAWKGQAVTPTLKSGDYFLNYTTSLTNYLWKEFSCSGSQINFSFSLRLDDYDVPDNNLDPSSEYQFEVSLGHGASNNINIVFADYNITGMPNKGLVVVLNGSTLVNSSAITYDEGVWHNYSIFVDLLSDTYDFFQDGNKIWGGVEMAAPLSVINNISFGWLNYMSPGTAYLDDVCTNISDVVPPSGITFDVFTKDKDTSANVNLILVDMFNNDSHNEFVSDLSSGGMVEFVLSGDYLYCVFASEVLFGFNISEPPPAMVYQNYYECRINASVGSYIAYLKRWANGTTLVDGHYWTERWADNFSYTDNPRHYGWFIDVGGANDNSDYETKVYSSYGRMLLANSSRLGGIFSHWLNVRDTKSLLQASVVLSSRELNDTVLFEVRDSSNGYLYTLKATYNATNSSKGEFYYWNTTDFVYAGKISDVKKPFRFRTIMNNSVGKYDLYLDSGNGVFSLVKAGQAFESPNFPYVFIVLPAGSDDTYIDDVLALDYSPVLANQKPFITGVLLNDTVPYENGSVLVSVQSTDLEFDNVVVAANCDWHTGDDSLTCSSPGVQCNENVSSWTNFSCAYDSVGLKKIKVYANDDEHGFKAVPLSAWTSTYVFVTVESPISSENWTFNYALTLNDYDTGNAVSGAVAEMFDVPTHGVDDYFVKVTDSAGYAFFNFSSLTPKFCLNATISSYLWYKDCSVDVSLESFLPRVDNRFLKKLDSGTYETSFSWRFRDNGNLGGKPEWYGWYHGNSEQSITWSSDSGYSYVSDAVLGKCLALNNSGGKGLFHKTYTVQPTSMFEFVVRMKPTTTSFVDSNELYVNLWGVSHQQVLALKAYTQDVGGAEKVFLQYWHPVDTSWKTVWNNTNAQVPFSIKVLTDVNSSSYSLSVKGFGLFSEVAAGVPFITASTQPAFFELKPVYTSNPNKDIKVDAIWFFDGIAAEDLLPEGVAESDVCNQYYYDSVAKRWKYDKNRCDACHPGESIFFCMFRNSFRWGIAKLTIWILRNFLYFLVLLILVILLAPIVIRLRRR